MIAFQRHIFILFVFFFAQANGQQQALVLSPVELLADSSFAADTKGTLAKGQLVEILQHSQVLHEDKTQTQQFYWYQVKDQDQNRGWVQGAELALLHLNPAKYIGIEQLTGGAYNMGIGFDSSVFYWGEVIGKDDVSSHFSSDNVYRENYLVFVNPQNKVIYLPAGTQSERGDNICQGVYFADMTGDGYQEIVLYRSLTGKEMDEEVRLVEVYQLVENQFQLIFEQRLNISFASMIPSPARYKFIDIQPDGIRIEYPQYASCGATHFGEIIKNQEVTYQKCMSWVTETFTWDKVSHRFNHFYQPSSLPLRAKTNQNGSFLREQPDIRSESILTLQSGMRLKVLAHLEKIVTIKNKKVARIFFLVKTNDGTIGYLPSSQITFVKSQHAALLNAFYTKPLLLKHHWQGKMDFIRLSGFEKEAHWEVTVNFSSGK